MYRVAAYSTAGSRKKTNQDSCCAEVAVTPHGDVALLAVCDGVGGLSMGELASSSVVSWLVNWFEYELWDTLDAYHDQLGAFFDHVQLGWEDGLTGLNAALRAHGRSTGERLGTTFTAILLYQGHYVIGHVGDTRVYCFFDGGMEQLTDDQTWVARELALGNITQAQARNHRKKNVIMQSVGTQTDLQPVFSRGVLPAKHATYMVCCDGFRNELFDDELTEAFSFAADVKTDHMRETIESLAELAMGRGEHDNITAVVGVCGPGMDYPDEIEADVATEADLPAQSYYIEPLEAAEQTTNLSDPSAAVGEAGERHG